MAFNGDRGKLFFPVQLTTSRRQPYPALPSAKSATNNNNNNRRESAGTKPAVLKAQQDALPNLATDDEESDQGRMHQQTGKASEEQQRGQQVLSLQARRSELEERLAAARSALSSARERKEFMNEEAEHAREYGKKLAQEMTRLARIAQTLSPEQSASLEKLRRLVVTRAEVERQERALREDARAREDALRAEIDDFIGEGATTADAPGDGSTAPVGLPDDGARASVGGETVVETTVEDPLAVMPKSGERGAKGEKTEKEFGAKGMRIAEGSGLHRMLVAGATSRMKQKEIKKEGRALLAEGLDRIEAAHEAAAAEREAAASCLSRLRLAVARRQREEDAAPGHAELLQYLLRFEELGHHAVERQNQLRRCRAERSTLALTREFLANQARLMETIASGVGDASKGSKVAREAYLRQLEGIVQGVEDHLANQTRLLNVTINRRKAAVETKEAVKEERKRFLDYTRDLSEECYRYDALTAHLALMGR